MKEYRKEEQLLGRTVSVHFEFEMLWYIPEVTWGGHTRACGSNSRENLGLKCKLRKHGKMAGVWATGVDINMAPDDYRVWETKGRIFI